MTEIQLSQLTVGQLHILSDTKKKMSEHLLKHKCLVEGVINSDHDITLRTLYKARVNAKGSASGRLGERDCKQQEMLLRCLARPFLAFPGFSALSSCGSP
ncbi:uncharacterized protein N7529_000208 [Penicillium soppii]|uniref:uncharacterized protein n=1 Tax=Penicillium soppii TaxID=69789 RepID=UPI002547C4D2|nr:uncharacterized protein N7529_000208 [Penicillium soppii]KAJ5881536.1 hypothetical protein N7529_000208 [Penicillium soppii]